MSKISLVHPEKIAIALQWIVQSHLPAGPARKPYCIKMIVGRDKVDESECAPNENAVSISGSGIRYWFRPYSEPGAVPFAYSGINTVFDFMRIAIWPHITDEWALSRLLEDTHTSDTEREAVAEYRRLEAEGKALNLKDIDAFLAPHPHLTQLYAAIQNADAAQLQLLCRALPDTLVEIGEKPIQDLASAFTSGDEKAIKKGKSYLIFRVLGIAGEAMMAAGRFDWHSREFHENAEKSSRQIDYLGRLARRKYANQFGDFCLSAPMLKLVQDISEADGTDAVSDFRAEATAFLAAKLASPEFSADFTSRADPHTAG